MTDSSRQAARKLGIPETTLSTYLKAGKIREPRSITAGNMKIYLWTEEEIERARKLLTKIANGRKTRYKKKHRSVSNQQSAKSGTQPGAAALHKTALHKTKETKKRKKH